MAISQLNVLFTKHHRIIFGVFAVLIIMAFVLADWVGSGTGGCSRGSMPAAGEIFGKEVSYAELNNQMHRDILALRVFMNVPVSGAMREQLENFSFLNLAHLAVAEMDNITASDEEVAVFLRSRFVDEKGNFSNKIYKDFVAGYLAAEGYTAEDLTEAARQQIILDKLRFARTGNIVVTPAEVKEFYNLLNGEYEVMAAEFKIADFEKSVQVKDDALNNFFMQKRDNYVIPAKAQALVLEMPFAAYRSQAIREVKDEQLKAFYEQNKQLFSTVKDGKVETPEFEKVKDQVRSSAIADAARTLAINAVNDFTSQAYEKIAEVAPEKRLEVFKKCLADAKLKVKSTGVFSANDQQAGSIGNAELVKELTAITADIPISNCVIDDKAAYSGYVTELVPARPAELAEVKAAVTKDYITAEAIAAAQARAAEVAAKLNAIPVEGRIARVQASKDPKFTAVPKFTLATGSQELMQNSMMVADMLPGEISEPLMTFNQSFQLLVVVKRNAPAKAYTDDPAVEAQCRSFKQAIAQQEYDSYINANCKRFVQPSAE
ncbi:MAG: hypothetical protein E7056_08420 [Lentisphaerae bacterium]|nr:hypothetical protein [Lentisphaerota bacterium]